MAKPEDKPSEEVQAFANALEEWAAQGPDQEQKQRLLKWLLSRCESRGFKAPRKSPESKGGKKVKNKYVIKRKDIKDTNIKDAVEDALAGYNPDLPTSGWVRGGPFWPKGYGEFWPKGYG